MSLQKPCWEDERQIREYDGRPPGLGVENTLRTTKTKHPVTREQAAHGRHPQMAEALMKSFSIAAPEGRAHGSHGVMLEQLK